MLTPEALELRRTGVTSGDISAIVGVSKHRSQWDVYNDKLGLVPTDSPPDEVVEMGNHMEAPLRDLYVTKMAKAGEVITVTIPGTYAREDDPLIVGSPDGIVYRDGVAVRGLEIKTAGMPTCFDFGEPGTDQVPTLYLVQCQWYMALTGLTRWDLIVWLGHRNQTQIYTITRHDGLISSLVATAHEWWDRHIVAKVPPPVDGTGACADGLVALFRDATKEIKAPSPEGDALIEYLRDAREKAKAAEEEKARAENLVKAFIGEAGGFVSSAGDTVTWSRFPVTRVGWKGVAETLGKSNPVLFAELVESESTGSASSRLNVPRSWGRE